MITRVDSKVIYPARGPPWVRSKTWRGLRSHWNFCINLAPWFPPDLGLINTMMGRLPVDGMGLTTNALLAALLAVEEDPVVVTWPLPPSEDIPGDDEGGVAPLLFRRLDPRSFRPRGDLRKLDLKFSRPGNLTIHDGGTTMLALGPVTRSNKTIPLVTTDYQQGGRNGECRYASGRGLRSISNVSIAFS